jgi:hypothetical protein
MTERVSIGFPHGGVCTAAFTYSLAQLVAFEIGHPTPDYKVDGLINAGGCYVMSNRNHIAQSFLGMGTDWLLQLDTDTEFKPNMLRTLMGERGGALDRRIIFGTYMNVVYDRKQQGDSKSTPTGFTFMFHRRLEDGNYATIEDVELDSTFEVDAAGTGCLLAHRSVYLALDKSPGGAGRFFPYGLVDGNDGAFLGEDLFFCQKVKGLGFKVYGTTKVFLRHWKALPISLQELWERM